MTILINLTSTLLCPLLVSSNPGTNKSETSDLKSIINSMWPMRVFRAWSNLHRRVESG